MGFYLIHLCGDGYFSLSVANLTELTPTRVKLNRLSMEELVDLLESRSRQAKQE